MDPQNVALRSHRTQVFLRNVSSGSEVVIDRAQSVEPSENFNTTPYYELGRTGVIGVTQMPPEWTVTLEQNQTQNMELEYMLAGLVPNPGIPQTYHLGQIVNQSSQLRMFLLNLNNSGSVMNEMELQNLSVADITWNFVINGVLTQTVTMNGTVGNVYTAGSTQHLAFGALDSVSVGGINGKDCRIWFTSGSAEPNRLYRAQSFTIRAAFPVEYVAELGRRSKVGTLSDSPDVTIDFDILLADDQPTEIFFNALSSGSGYNLQEPRPPLDCFVRVFDPNDPEGVTTIKMWRLENVVPTTHTPIRAQVRQLSTARYSLRVSRETTLNSGGLRASNSNNL